LDPADEPMRKRPPGAASEETTGSYALLVTPTRTKRLLNASSGHSPGALGDRLLLLTINPARMGYGLMLGLDTVESVAHVIQVALTPVFLLSGIASLLGVLSTRLARVADRVDALAEQLEADGPVDRRKLQRRLAYLRRRSHVLDAAVMMGTLGGVATSCAALLLFVGTLRDRPGVSLFVAFGLALLFTMGALVAFLIEMLLASRGLRDQANYANEVGEMHELAAEGVGEPTRGESG
jgi:cytochrome c biogenesis protein CcdA